jgi:hypothetical protein
LGWSYAVNITLRFFDWILGMTREGVEQFWQVVAAKVVVGVNFIDRGTWQNVVFILIKLLCF